MNIEHCWFVPERVLVEYSVILRTVLKPQHLLEPLLSHDKGMTPASHNSNLFLFDSKRKSRSKWLKTLALTICFMKFCELWSWAYSHSLTLNNIICLILTNRQALTSSVHAVQWRGWHDSELLCRTDGFSNSLLHLTACCVLYTQPSCHLAVVTKYSACSVIFFFSPLFTFLQLHGRFILFYLLFGNLLV